MYRHRTYRHYLDIAAAVRQNSREQFKIGVERVAALAAMAPRDGETAIDAMERAFGSMRSQYNPSWDGSIA
jgi:hypothetical protein